MPVRRILITTDEAYGVLEDVVLRDAGTRYVPVDPGLHRGVSLAGP